MHRTILPSWITDLLPEPVEPHVISLEGEDLVLTGPGEKEVNFGSDFQGLSSATRNVDVIFNEEVQEKFGIDRHTLGLTFPASKTSTGVIMSHTDQDRLRSLEGDFEDSLRHSLKYQADPSDFYNSYYLVDTHPVFWLCYDVEKSPWYWRTTGHAETLSQYVDKNNGQIVIGLETGSHVEPDFKGHYHDYRLDVYADTFENAFIELAAMVNKFHYPDGTDKLEVDHIKPQWIVDLEDRIKEIDKVKEA